MGRKRGGGSRWVKREKEQLLERLTCSSRRKTRSIFVRERERSTQKYLLWLVVRRLQEGGRGGAGNFNNEWPPPPPGLWEKEKKLLEISSTAVGHCERIGGDTFRLRYQWTPPYILYHTTPTVAHPHINPMYIQLFLFFVFFFSPPFSIFVCDHFESTWNVIQLKTNYPIRWTDVL